MKIVIEDGKPVVVLKASEIVGLKTTLRLAGELLEWLKDQDAEVVLKHLQPIIDRYVPADQS